jgi:hypothetical protein
MTLLLPVHLADRSDQQLRDSHATRDHKRLAPKVDEKDNYLTSEVGINRPGAV